MKVLVTGGLGFLGQYVCNYLEDNGHQALAMDRFKIFSKEKERKGESFLGDVRDRNSVSDAVSRVEGVIHLAGILGTQECIDNPFPAVDTNINGGLNVLEALAQYNVPGSFLSLGNWWMNNTYSISKNTIDRFCEMYVKHRGVRCNVVRAVNAYGPGQKASAPYGTSKVRKVIPSFICRALNNDPIEIYGDGDQYADMVYAGDVAKALVQALLKAKKLDLIEGVVGIGPESHTTVASLAKRIKAMCDSTSEIVHLPMRPGEIPENVVADTAKMKYLDMMPADLMPLAKGLHMTIKYYRG